MKPELNITCTSVEENNKDGETVKSLELSGSMPKDILVYRQDVVRCSKREGLLGMVMEVSGDSDSEGSITDENDSENEEQQTEVEGDADGDKNDGTVSGADDGDSLPDDQVRVTWIDGSETTENISDVMVVDRSFLHGDIVAIASNPTGQLGLITDVDVKVDLLSASGELIKDVSSRDLKRISEFTVGDFVVHGSWLGRVDEVLDNVTVLFDDGSVCKVVKADPLRLRPVKKAIIDDADCPYYPGQRVRAVSSSVFKTSRWLSGLWKANRLEGTVIKVQTASVIVYWIASAYLGDSSNPGTVPPEEQNPKNLTLLSCFSHANWQLADWCLLPLPQSNSASKLSNHRESAGGCNSTSEQTYDHLSSHAEGPGRPLDGHDPDIEINGGPSHLLGHTLDLQADSEHVQNDSEGNLSTLKDGISQPSNNESMSLDKIKLGQNPGSELNDLPENCSCSSASSFSKEPSQENWPTYRKKLRKVLFRRDKKTRKRDENFEKAFLIVNTITKVNVAWQDGTVQFGLPSTALIPIHTPNDNEFFPEQYVVEKASSEGEGSDISRIGVVRSVNSRDRTVCVRWLKMISRPEEPREFDVEEVVSAYELDGHPDYDYCYGDVVVRLPPVSGDMTTSAGPEDNEEMFCSARDTEDESSAKDVATDKEEQQSLKDQASESFTSLPWVGNITSLQDGDIVVTWIDGMVSKVGPQEIYVVGRDDDSFDGGSEVSEGGASWETVNDNEMDTLDITEKEDSQSHIDNTAENGSASSQEDNNVGRGGPLAVPLAALDYVTRLATGLFYRAKRQLDSSGSDQMDSIEQDKPEEYFESHAVLDGSENSSCEEDKYKEPDFVDGLNAENMDVTEEEDYDVAVAEVSRTIENIEKEGSVGEDDNLCEFKHFDIAENPVDHHFSDGAAKTGGRKWAKKIQQEWNILKKNLPDDIYVRVFEDRMDLLRAAIVGACGTPYQDGLFFFDFYLPPEYPETPPSVYYHSGGLRVNPNLYVDGKVCLSLLNTWTGKGNEVWDPSSSSILQVLVSLQGLVLNSKPYFNEAGYEKQIGTVEGEKNSLPYNENTYLLNLKSIMYLLRRPPMHFEDFVKNHFKRRGRYILKACEAYMGDCLIGSLTEDCCLTERSKGHSCSVGFKLTLAKILPRLIPALKEVGADCSQFEHLIKSESLQESR